VKIGGTKNHPNERARDLNTTGVQFDWIVSYYEEVSDWELVEKLLHTHFESQRPNPNREFFNVEPREAIERLRKFASLYQITKSFVEANSVEDKASISEDPSSETLADTDVTQSEDPIGWIYELSGFPSAPPDLSAYGITDPDEWIHFQCEHCTCRFSEKAKRLHRATCPVCQRRARLPEPAYRKRSDRHDEDRPTGRIIVGHPTVMPVIGASPMRESQVAFRVRDYIDRHQLWCGPKDGDVKTNEVLRDIIGNKPIVSIHELLSVIRTNLKSFSKP
jgi:hypothetical protein